MNKSDKKKREDKGENLKLKFEEKNGKRKR